MKTTTAASQYKGYRFPTESISHGVWLSLRCSLSFRDGEELLAQRGVVLPSETVRQWCLKFGQTDANELRKPSPGLSSSGLRPWPGHQRQLLL